MGNNLRWKTTFDGGRALMEGKFDGRQPLMVDTWKMTFDGTKPLIGDIFN